MSPLRRTQRTLRDWLTLGADTWRLVHDSVKAHPLRSLLAILGIVIGIVTVVLVASVLANVRNQVALLFRELATLSLDAPLGVESPDALRWEGVPRAPFEELAARLAAPALMGRVHRWAD